MFRMEIRKYKNMLHRDIHLTIKPSTFNKYYIIQILVHGYYGGCKVISGVFEAMQKNSGV